ncbi:MAG: hypothetical protein RR623_10330 [Bacilli bacterium]
MEIKQNEYEQFLQFMKFKEMQSTDFKAKRREKGTGSITKLSGNRRRHYLASVTVGYEEFTGKQIQKPLAYFYERKHGDKALDIYLLEKDGKCASGTLLEYINSVEGSMPKDKILDVKLDKSYNDNDNCPTLKQTYMILQSELWWNKSKNTMIAYKTAFNHFKKYHDTKVCLVRLKEIEPIFQNLMKKGCNFSTLNSMTIVLGAIYKYCIKHDWVEKNYVKFIQIEETMDKSNKKKTIPYSDNDIKKLFELDNNIIAQSILVDIYTGLRPSELVLLKPKNIHVKDRYMIGGIKTENGIDRVIPIHECIVGYIENMINEKAIIGWNYDKYLYHYNKFRDENSFDKKLTLYSARHTFASLSKKYKLNEFYRRVIFGHSQKSLMDNTYTHASKEDLINEVNKIPTLR